MEEEGSHLGDDVVNFRSEKVRDALRVERLASVLRIYPYTPWNNAGNLSESLPSGGENSRIGSQHAVDKFEK